MSAGVAHSIRNPLTSVKMRLFSLERSLNLNDIQREDFDVISEEIGHLNTIVANFLEFARPPRLRMQRTSLSEVVDMTPPTGPAQAGIPTGWRPLFSASSSCPLCRPTRTSLRNSL